MSMKVYLLCQLGTEHANRRALSLISLSGELVNEIEQSL